MKKYDLKSFILFTLTGLITLSSSAYANGFYAGVNGGYDSTDFYKTLTIVQNGSQTYDKQDNLNGEGFFVGPIIGYQFDIGRGFLAAELDGNLNSIKYNGWFIDNTSQLGQTSSATLTLKNSYGASILSGYNLNPNVALYGRIGWERADFEYSEYKADLGEPSYGVTEHEWLDGWKLGAGVNVALTPHTALRLEYNHLKYNTFVDTNFQLGDGQFRTMKLAPQSNQIQLGFIYKFS